MDSELLLGGKYSFRVSGSRTKRGVVSGGGIGTQDRQQRFGPGVIGRPGSMVAEQDTAVGVNDEDPWELAHVTFGNADSVALGHGRHPPEYHFCREQRPNGGLFEAKGLEKPFFRVGNHGKGDVETFFEFRRLLDIAQPNKHHCSTQAVKGIFFAAQLRHLLAAKRSTVMPQKNQHQWALPPEFAQRRPRVIPQLDLSFADCTHIQIHAGFLSSLVDRSFPKPHEGTEVFRRHDTDELPFPGYRQQVASTFAQRGNNCV
jgi:hypothetical protein